MKKPTLLVLAIALTFGLALPGCKKTEKVVVAGPAPTTPVELKVKWPVGSKIIYDMELKQNSETRVPGTPAPIKQDVTMNLQNSLKVLRELADGGREVEMEFLRIRMEAVVANQPARMQFDSEDKSSTNATSLAFRQMVGAKLQLFLDASNEVWKVEGAEEFEKRFSTAGSKDVMTAALAGIFNKDFYKELASQGAKILPGKPVQPGDTWPVQQEISMGQLGNVTMDYTCTFKSWERRDEHNCAHLEYAGTFKGDRKGNPGAKVANLKMDMTFDNGKSTGEAWFDYELGRFVESTQDQDMQVLMTMANPRPAPRGAKPGPATLTITNVVSQVVAFKVTPAK